MFIVHRKWTWTKGSNPFGRRYAGLFALGYVDPYCFHTLIVFFYAVVIEVGTLIVLEGITRKRISCLGDRRLRKMPDSGIP